MTFIPGLAQGKALDLKTELPIEQGSLRSKTLVDRASLSMILFALDTTQELSTHTAPGDAMVTVLSGCARITIDGTDQLVQTGETIVMPANIPHAVFAVEAMHMLLVLVKLEAEESACNPITV